MIRNGARSLASALLLVLLPAQVLAVDRQFESPHVRALDISPDGTKLFALNTPDHRLVVFDLTQGPLPVVLAEIQVGIEPVAVRARGNDEVWVVNHISDTVSIIDLATLNIERTLLVGDEPTDVGFAGVPEKAFVVVSQLDLVRVYDTANLDAAPAEIPLDASDPFAIAVSPDTSKVYVSILDSQNRTTVVREATVDSTMGLPPPSPPMDSTLTAPPVVSLIVRHDGVHWVDEIGRSWDAHLPYTLLDNDVIEIDAATSTVTQAFDGVGTVLTNLEVNPVTGRIYVSNLESFNEVRFEPNLKGVFTKTRVTHIDPGTATVTPVHLNDHIDYGVSEGSPAERGQSLGLPMGIAVHGGGDTVYVAAMGSNKVGVLDGDGNVLRRIGVGSGPTGVVLDEPRNRLYVLNRNFGTLSVVDLSDDSSVELGLGFDPTPPDIEVGRALFYSTTNSSSHGDISCASCHVFANTDGLAWDLGDPTGDLGAPPQAGAPPVHPMKGPMVTQSLRGLPDTQPFHWRGDKPTLADFNGAFASLQGRADTLSAPDMALFNGFLESVQYPPNPMRNLDGTLQDPASGPNPANGEFLFFNVNLYDGGNKCSFCHFMPNGTANFVFPPSQIQENQALDTASFRSLYEKTRFTPQGPTSVRGFGYIHSGEEPSLFQFLFRDRFDFDTDDQRRDIESFLLRFDTGTHAAVGQQLTMDGTNEAALTPRLDTFRAVAAAGAADLIAKGIQGGEARGWRYGAGQDEWNPDRAEEGAQTTAALLALAGPGTEVTFTAVVPGCGTRLGVDRDEDGYYDRDERDAGTDPGDPDSFPGVLASPVTDVEQGSPALTRVAPNPIQNGEATVAYRLEASGPVSIRVHDVQGRLVRDLLEETRHPGGAFIARWDLRDEAGRRVRAGVYFVNLAAGGDRSGRRLVVLQ